MQSLIGFNLIRGNKLSGKVEDTNCRDEYEKKNLSDCIVRTFLYWIDILLKIFI